MRRNKKLRQW